MSRARDIANLVDANGDIVAGALDNVPAADLVNDTTPQLGGALDAQSYAITSVGNMTARTEGNGTTFDMRAGSAKAAMFYNHSSNSITHSLNTSSATDSASGVYRINYSNNFNQTRPYAMNNSHQMFNHMDGTGNSTTTYCQFKTRDGSKAAVDSSESNCVIHGSLA